ncbi:Protein CWC15 homolog [Seminavis robusta]|uniref:Protein CWC15 homolog n=1 Tax=Seminavis robusta TaxID=568900 RepID=A0A9N8EBS0_9STRA|nr:Protein CWC15 homolog [Seminavis robusta]|eukprot:Sro729_g193770.1 Protein CWC15 homolog (226) ;mRNA; f:6413-7168
MTTAHRPTWKAAVGRAQEGGWTAGGSVSTSISALDVAAHTKLKTRSGQQLIDKKKALKESLLALEKAEASSSKHKIGKRPIVEAIEAEGRQKLLKQTTEVDEVALKKKYDDEDRGGDDSDGWSDVDRDASDKDTELAKIRAEREAVKAKAEAEAAAEEEEQMGEAAMIGNPLLASGEASAKMKRKWNEDVVFRNQAKGEPKPKKRFINDTVRNDFHKRFLNKFIR